MARIKRLPDFELEAMLVIWNAEGPIHTGEILQQITGKQCRIQALQSILRRLESKGFIHCEKLGRLNYYTPLIDKENYKAQETATFLDKLYGNSPVRLIAALVQNCPLSEQELQEIRQILDKGGE